MRVQLAFRARSDIEKIHEYLSVRNAEAAERLERVFRAVFEELACFPALGMPTDIRQVHRLPIANWPYSIFYHLDRERGMVTVLRVVHSKRLRNLSDMPD
jgi:plasmid stabilization system protein ParE